jgi:hypothetical protein
MRTSMDEKRYNALRVIEKDLCEHIHSLPEPFRLTQYCFRLRHFYQFVHFILHAHPSNITNYPIKYNGAVTECAYLLEKYPNWKYLIELDFEGPQNQFNYVG